MQDQRLVDVESDCQLSTFLSTAGVMLCPSCVSKLMAGDGKLWIDVVKATESALKLKNTLDPLRQKVLKYLESLNFNRFNRDREGSSSTDLTEPATPTATPTDPSERFNEALRELDIDAQNVAVPGVGHYSFWNRDVIYKHLSEEHAFTEKQLRTLLGPLNRCQIDAFHSLLHFFLDALDTKLEQIMAMACGSGQPGAIC